MKVLSLTATVLLVVPLNAFSPLKSIRNRFGKKADLPALTTHPPVAPPLEHNTNNNEVLTDKELTDVFAQNKVWIKEKLAADPSYFTKLGSTHKPDYMWIGCADARVPANEVMGKDAGTVFVTRNVANMVVNTDVNLMAALQYAVNVLKVSHIIVCGHYDCGGVRAAETNKDHAPPLENWLRNIRDVYRIHRKELDAIKDPEMRHRRLVELNVIEQCINLFKTGAIQRQRIATYKAGLPYTTPRIHATVFEPKTGVLQPLQVSFKEYITELSEIYNLYDPQEE